MPPPEELRKNLALRARVNDLASSFSARLKPDFGFPPDVKIVEGHIATIVRAFGEEGIKNEEETFNLVRQKMTPVKKEAEAM